MTNKYDMRWKQGDYHYYENLIPKLKDDAPQWVVDSYNHYMQQLHDEFGDREWDDEKGISRSLKICVMHIFFY